MGGAVVIVPKAPEDKKLWGGGPGNRSHKLVWLDALAGSELKPASVLTVLYAMSNRANGSAPFFVTIDDLEEVLRGTLKRRQIERGVATGIESGWMPQVKRGGSTAGGSSWYRLAIPTEFEWPLLKRTGKPAPVNGDGQEPEGADAVPATATQYPPYTTLHPPYTTEHPPLVTYQ